LLNCVIVYKEIETTSFSHPFAKICSIAKKFLTFILTKDSKNQQLLQFYSKHSVMKTLFLTTIILAIFSGNLSVFAQATVMHVRMSAEGYSLIVNYDKAQKISHGDSPKKLTLNNEEIQELLRMFDEDFFALSEQEGAGGGQRVALSVQARGKTKQLIFFCSDEKTLPKKLQEVYDSLRKLAEKF
jgi:hypothetical protein